MKLAHKLTSAALVLASASLVQAATRFDPKDTTAHGLKNFGFSLFQSLYKTEDKEPVAVSPMSLGEALILATAGAEKETAGELTSLFVPPSAIAQGANASMLVEGISRLRGDLVSYAKNSNGAFVFTSANSLVGNSNRSVQFKYKPGFQKLAQEKFGASVVDYDFQDRATVGKINAWVDKNTQGKITELINKLEADDVAVLLNAVYSRGKFLSHFGALTEGKYTNAEGKTLDATYMSQSSYLEFAENKDVKVLSLAIGDSSKPTSPEIALDILVPTSTSDLDKLVASLSGKAYTDLVGKLKPEMVELKLPASLVKQKEALRLGSTLTSAPFKLDRPFDQDNAQFGPMGSTVKEANLYINDVAHKVFYEVTPFGFEAAAATAVIMAGATSMPQYKPVSVEGPSVHVIRHIPTGTPLFISVVDSPVKYDEKRLVEFIEIGVKSDKRISAEVADGVMRATYARSPAKVQIVVVDKNGKVVRTVKSL